MWQDHYTAILNSVQNFRYKKNVNWYIAQIGADSIKLTISTIFDALKLLKVSTPLTCVFLLLKVLLSITRNKITLQWRI